MSSVEEVTELLGDWAPQGQSAPSQQGPDMSERERRVWESLQIRGSIGLDELVRTSGLGVQDVSTALGILDASGRVTSDGRGWRVAT